VITKVRTRYPSLSEDERLSMSNEYMKFETEKQKAETTIQSINEAHAKEITNLSLSIKNLTSQNTKLQTMYSDTQNELTNLKSKQQSPAHTCTSACTSTHTPPTKEDPEMKAVLKYARERLDYHIAETRRIDKL
jgi:predicted RNase H-like nuclease (RuvC/YqgF family)